MYVNIFKVIFLGDTESKRFTPRASDIAVGFQYGTWLTPRGQPSFKTNAISFKRLKLLALGEAAR